MARNKKVLLINGVAGSGKTYSIKELINNAGSKVAYINLDGKSARLSAKILTPSGWTTHGEIRPGDNIFNERGGIEKVIAIHPQGVLDSYEMEYTDGSKMICSKDHLWTYHAISGNKKYTRTKTLGEIDDMSSNTKNSIFFPIANGVSFKEQNHYISPYLLGVLIGDGSLSGGVVGITNSEKDIIEKVSLSLNDKYKCSIISKENTSLCNIISKKNTKNNEYKKEIIRLKLNIKSDIKFIPKEYLIDSYENRLNLLHGLMDTDGNVYVDKKKRGRPVFSYTTTSEQLKEDILFLAKSLGYDCRFNTEKREKTMTYRNLYRIQIGMFGSTPLPFSSKKHNEKLMNVNYTPRYSSRLGRKLKGIKRVGSEEMLCITTSNPTSLYITDDMIVTHNTRLGFKGKSKIGKFITPSDPLEVNQGIRDLEEDPDIEYIIIDTLSFYLDQLEQKHVIFEHDSQGAWGL